MKLKQTVYFLLLTVCCLLLTACNQTAVSPVSFLVFGDPAEFAAYENLVAAFTSEHPDIHIELGHIPSQSDYRQRLATAFSGGAPPDVMLLNYRRFATFADQGGLEPLDHFLAQSDLISESDFWPNTVESFYLNGRLWCIPQNMSSLVVYYNKDLFDAADWPYPTDDWTREDFLAAALALTQDMDGDGRIDQYGAAIAPNLFRLAPFIWQNGGQLVDDRDNPTQLTIDSPASLAAWRWFVDLQVIHQVVPDAVAESAQSSESRFLNGRLAMIFNSRRGVPTYRTITGFAWDVAPLPRGPQTASILHSDAYCMAANTENKEAAWTFIEFANSPTGQEIVADSGRTVPSLQTVAQSEAFLDPAQPPTNSRVFINNAPSMRRVPIMTTWAGIEETVSKEIERSFYGQVSVTEAAETAVSLSQTYFDRAQKQP